MNTAIRTVDLDGIGSVEVSVAEYGAGQPFLLLHGGAGPQSVTGFAERFAAAHDVRILVPTHPGFGGTPRPEALRSIPGLAALYNALLDQIDLQDVTVTGNSIGGWITAEIALLKSPRVSGLVLNQGSVRKVRPTNLDQVAAVGNAGDRGLGHDPAPCGSRDRLVAGQRGKAEKSVSALSQIAWMTWSGVSSCGECPVSASNWNRAMGIAAAYARP